SADSGVHKSLALFRELILRIFRQIAVRAGDRDLLREFYIELMFESVDLVLELLLDLLEWVVRHCSSIFDPISGGSLNLAFTAAIIKGGELRRQARFGRSANF